MHSTANNDRLEKLKGLEDVVVFTGNANPDLSREVVDRLGLPIGKAQVSTFSDGEISVEIMENVRKKDIFIIQPTCAPSNDNLMELLIMIDALKRASAGNITAVVPYLGYARQDRRPRTARVAISAKLVAKMICQAGASQV
ncbi:MAG: ribose-phosphate pyrophosphokinase, partial [Parvicella sp.]